jgi:hypothetical protein
VAPQCNRVFNSRDVTLLILDIGKEVERCSVVPYVDGLLEANLAHVGAREANELRVLTKARAKFVERRGRQIDGLERSISVLQQVDQQR